MIQQVILIKGGLANYAENFGFTKIPSLGSGIGNEFV